MPAEPDEGSLCRIDCVWRVNTGVRHSLTESVHMRARWGCAQKVKGMKGLQVTATTAGAGPGWKRLW